ncbi:MAG: UDP-N-acetylmuramoyl-L-alanine--D-glutamate ligase [Candidatus Marinimicrobia bacterium]|nr:UDP-N-acetylmuramoyl-L-alanine--D-glutamate ligase [Candidatus Neomarinimicrobiota bacterium]
MDIGIRNQIDLKDRKVTVIGAERSGIAASRLLISLGAYVFLSEKKSTCGSYKDITGLESQGVVTEFGGHTKRIYDCDLIVVSPGVPQDAKILINAADKGIPIVGEIELASWFTNRPIVAVTGSNGKTTTTTILSEMCKQGSYKTFLAGNIGIPFSNIILENLENEPKNAVYVLEISSFQMEYILHFKPQIAVLLNLTADHLDRYKSIRDYAIAKMRIIENMTQEDYIVFNDDDPVLCEWIESPAQKVPFSLKKNPSAYFSVNETKIYNDKEEILIYLKDVSLPGKHNLSNFLAAATASKILDIPQNGIQQVIKTFRGVPHRIEFVRTLDGSDYFNDSKATNMESVKVALDSFERPIILILGGREKGADFKDLIMNAKDKVKLTITLGEAAVKIEKALSSQFLCIQVNSMEEAVKTARINSEPGDIILLSPGCASFDMFADFENRGEVFKVAVHQLDKDKS